jgi:hypothetical protein
MRHLVGQTQEGQAYERVVQELEKVELTDRDLVPEAGAQGEVVQELEKVELTDLVEREAFRPVLRESRFFSSWWRGQAVDESGGAGSTPLVAGKAVLSAVCRCLRHWCMDSLHRICPPEGRKSSGEVAFIGSCCAAPWCRRREIRAVRCGGGRDKGGGERS